MRFPSRISPIERWSFCKVGSGDLFLVNRLRNPLVLEGDDCAMLVMDRCERCGLFDIDAYLCQRFKGVLRGRIQSHYRRQDVYSMARVLRGYLF